MSAQRLLGLPPITPELKSISPYLQRADELKSQDQIMAYWCAYYAAQVGIAIKAKDTPSRDVLFALLGTLERLKKDIGPNDAVDMEPASSAYVENFALKVFAMADNEDRRGDPTRYVQPTQPLSYLTLSQVNGQEVPRSSQLSRSPQDIPQIRSRRLRTSTFLCP